MTREQVIKGLTAISHGLRRLLESSSITVLDSAVEQVKKSYERYASTRRQTHHVASKPDHWGFEIYRERPLRFIRVEVDKVAMQPDLFCSYKWNDDGLREYNLVLRVWCFDPRIIQGGADSDARCTNHRTQRVMLRYHFERANPGQQSPRFHVQAGGKAAPEEGCPLHEGVCVPRLAHPPMDLALACEMVVYNFFQPEERAKLRDSLFRGVIRTSQTDLLAAYYNACVRAIDSQESVLGALWEVQ